MTSKQVDSLLKQADACVRTGDWEAALAQLIQASRIEPGHTGAMSGRGTCLIQLGRMPEAIQCFQKVVEFDPDSPEAHNNLGVAYALATQLESAEGSYQRAIDLDPEHAPAWKNLAMVHLQQGQLVEGVQILAAVVKSNPKDTEALFLLARCYEEGDDHASARELYQEVLRWQPRHVEARQALARLPGPAQDLPRIARGEHAKKLAALKSLKQRTVSFYGPPMAASETRLGPPARALADLGYTVSVNSKFSIAELDRSETVVFANPHCSPPLLDALTTCLEVKKRVILDLDRDHYDHAGRGPASPDVLETLEGALGRVDLVTVPTRALAGYYANTAKRVEVIPYAWDRSNSLWEKPAPPRESIHIGMVGGHTGAEDLAVLRSDVTRLIRDVPQTMLVTAIDLTLYQAFNALPEKRRLFIPAPPPEDYPFLLAHFDILLFPLQNNASSQFVPDLPLLEAGLRRIPWVATPNPAFEEWGAGGIFVRRGESWFKALKPLVTDASRRIELGEAGWQKAQEREIGQIGQLWKAVIAGER